MTSPIPVCPRCHLPLTGCDMCKGDQGADAKPPTVGERLAALGSIHAERGAVYGDDYKHFGKVLMGMFPRGLTLETAEEFCRFGMFVMMATKLSRYAQNMKRGGHADSLDDVAVYSQLQRSVDAEMEKKT